MLARILKNACAGLMLLSSAAMAQDVGTPTTPAKPDVKTIGDWFVRCYPVQSVSPCDLFQEQDSQASHQRILSLSFAYVPSADKHAVQITVPLEISIQKGLTVSTDSYTSPVLKYRMCNRDGCFVQMMMDNSMVEALARGGASGKVSIVADNGKSYALPFSLKGFAQAHDEMVSQARAKAKAPAAAPAADAAAPAATP